MAKAVRAGVRLEQGVSGEVSAPGRTESSQDAPTRRRTIWERITSLGRRTHETASANSSWPGVSAGAVGIADVLLKRTDELKRATDILLQRTDFLMQRRAVPLGNQEVLVRTTFGWLIVPAEDEALLTCMLEGGALEPGTTTVLTRIVKEGDTVVDVGANIGLLTLPAARRVGATGKVVAVEPVPRLVNVLQRSMHINGMADRVMIETCAAAAGNGTAQIHVGKVLGYSSLLPVEVEVDAVDVRLCPLDELVSAEANVSLVKIDTEGYELDVWRGMRRIVSENPGLAVIVEFGPSHLQRAGVNIGDWLRELLAPGFRAFEIDEETGRCKPLRDRGLDQIFSVNLLLLRRPPSAYPDIDFQ